MVYLVSWSLWVLDEQYTIVSRNDLNLVSTSDPVVSRVGTTNVGMVPFMLILRYKPRPLTYSYTVRLT